MRHLLGIDVGGTFTDLCLWDGRGVRTAKTPSTPDDYLRGILDGMSQLGLVEPRDAAAPPLDLVHGSTVATNALIERAGERVAFLATASFEDLLHIGRQDRPDLYTFAVRRSPALVEPGDCHGVTERVGSAGEVLEPLDEFAAATLFDRLKREGITTAAACLLFSFLNPAHEQRLVELGRARGVRVFASSDVLPEFREYERASTTVVNAYVAPKMERYLARLEPAVRRRGVSSLRVMQSSGGQISAAQAATHAVRTILSGPAGGVVAARRVAAAMGIARVISYDMGGTSTDVALCDGEPAVRTDSRVGGLPVAVPMLAIHTVGAGGGSLARIDSGGALRVGPESAGADPGPACYGRSDRPTVTDAHVVLGRIRPDAVLGGRMPIDPRRSHNALARLGAEMGCDGTAAARAVVDVCTAGMEHALSVVSAQQGYDPSDFHLISFGGAGGLHACALADALDLAGVIVPAESGVLSACGLIHADILLEFSRSLPRRDDSIDLNELRYAMSALMDQAYDAVIREGYDADDGEVERFVDLRYRGQAYELTVPLESMTDLDRLGAPFHALHEQRFGFADPSRPVEAITLRARARIPAPSIPQAVAPDPSPPGGTATAPVPPPPSAPASATVWFDRPTETPLIYRSHLASEEELTGPALLLDDASTTLLPPDWTARRAAGGHLRLTRGASG